MDKPILSLLSEAITVSLWTEYGNSWLEDYWHLLTCANGCASIKDGGVCGFLGVWVFGGFVLGFLFVWFCVMVANINLKRKTLSFTLYPCSSLPCQEPMVGLPTLSCSSSCLTGWACSAGPRAGRWRSRCRWQPRTSCPV